MAGAGITDKTQEIGYGAGRAFMYASGKHAAMGLGGIEHGAAATATALGTAVGLSAVVSAALTQMDFRHKVKNIQNFYQEEIAAKSGKSAESVTQADADKVMAQNKIMDEAVSNTRRQRNFNFAFSILATIASVATVIALGPAMAPLLPAGALGIAAELGANAVVSILAYNAVKQPLHKLGDKLFELDKETTHDRLVKLEQDRHSGRQVTQEQVLEIFAGANERLDQYVRQHYGAPAEELPIKVKKQAAVEINQSLPLDTIADSINQGKLPVGELAFMMQGDVSGALESKPRQKQWQYDNPTPAKPFVKQLGLAPRDTSLTHVQRHDNSSVPIEREGP